IHVANDSDDLILLRITVVLIHVEFLDALTNRILIREITLRERVVDNRRTDRASLILFSEITTFQQRNADGLKVLRRNVPHIRHWLPSRFRDGTTIDLEVSAEFSSAERHRRNESSTLNAGQRLQTIESLSDITLARVSVVECRSAERDASTQHIIRIETRLNVD